MHPMLDIFHLLGTEMMILENSGKIDVLTGTCTRHLPIQNILRKDNKVSRQTLAIGGSVPYAVQVPVRSCE
jgi:hypothetical protein